MKTGWELTSLRDVSTISYGYTESASDEPVGPKFLRITDIQDGDVNWDHVPYCRIAADEMPKYRLKTNDIVFARTGATTGKSFLIEEAPEAVFASYLIRLRLQNGRLLPKFVSFFFQSNTYWKSVREGSTGSAQGGFNATKLGGLTIPIPPIPEQRRIVAVLDKAFAAIATAKANTEKNLQNARALLQSELDTIFQPKNGHWTEAAIGEHVRFIDYRGRTPKKTTDGIRLFTAKNVKMGYLQDTPAEFIAPGAYKGWMTRGIPRRGDVLFTTEAPLANVCQLDTDDRVAFAQRIIIMQPDPEHLDSTFLKYLLLSPPVQKRIREKGTGATVQGIKARLLKGVPIAFPRELTAQREIVNRLDEVATAGKALENTALAKVAHLEELKKSLLQRAFSGTL